MIWVLLEADPDKDLKALFIIEVNPTVPIRNEALNNGTTVSFQAWSSILFGSWEDYSVIPTEALRRFQIQGVQQYV